MRVSWQFLFSPFLSSLVQFQSWSSFRKHLEGHSFQIHVARAELGHWVDNWVGSRASACDRGTEFWKTYQPSDSRVETYDGHVATLLIHRNRGGVKTTLRRKMYVRKKTRQTNGQTRDRCLTLSVINPVLPSALYSYDGSTVQMTNIITNMNSTNIIFLWYIKHTQPIKHKKRKDMHTIHTQTIHEVMTKLI